jgi:hypothetical protein
VRAAAIGAIWASERALSLVVGWEVETEPLDERAELEAPQAVA